MLRNHGESSKTAAVAAGRKRVHTTYKDGTEMVEEYDIVTDELVTRKWKDTAMFHAEKWEYEIGEAQQQGKNDFSIGIATSATNPIFLCRDTKQAWQWRIRNLPYPKNVYQLSIDSDKQDIVLRTTNKKYFKRFCIPDMRRRGLKLEEGSLSFSHSNNTLVIEYDKPSDVLQYESNERSVRMKGSSKDGDVECKQQ